jgi:hypothetical protein
MRMLSGFKSKCTISWGEVGRGGIQKIEVRYHGGVVIGDEGVKGGAGVPEEAGR